MPRRRTFRQRLFVIFVGAVTVPLLLVALTTSLLLNARLQAQRTADVTNLLEPMAGQIENNFAELDRIAFAPYLYQGMLDALNYMNRGYLDNPPSWLEPLPVEHDYLATMQRLEFTSKQRIRSITFYPANPDREVTYRIVPVTSGLIRETKPGYHTVSWFTEALANGKTFLGPIREGAERTYSLAVAIRDMDRRRSIGVLRIDASADVILDGLARAGMQAGDRILLLDGNQRIRYDSDAPAQATGSFDEATAGGSATVVSVALEPAQWRLVYLAADQSVRATVLAIAIAVLIALGTTLVAWVVYRRELRSTLADVEGITTTLRRIEEGDLAATTTVRGSDEIGMIADSVNHLGQALRDHIDQEYKAVIAKQNAEYRALQAQLSPHFLHNVLNDLVALNRLGDRDKLEASILRVSRLLRYSCSTADTATVDQEVAFAEQYLYLRQLQLDDRLHYTIDVDPNASEVNMPRLVVQPLVENSLKHGLREGATPINIQVTARTADGWLELRVSDDGNCLAQAHAGAPSGFATMSIDERLRILAPGSSLVLDSTAGVGTTCLVRMRVPQPAGGAR